MQNKQESINRKHEKEVSHSDILDKDKIHQSLKHLREIAKNLPVVDAVTIIREGREIDNQGKY